MKFEIQVTQNGIVSWGENTETCSTVVAIFRVGANTVDDALLKMVESKEFQNIDRIDNLTIGVVEGMPTYYLGKE